jgi:hypothetical protein
MTNGIKFQLLSRTEKFQIHEKGKVHPIFSVPDPGAHPASYAMGTGSLSRGYRRLGRGLNHPPSSSAEIKEKVELQLYSPFGPLWPVVGGNLPF